MMDNGFIYDVGSDIVAVAFSATAVEVHPSQKTFFCTRSYDHAVEGRMDSSPLL